ncbi:MAG: HEAT repeat domain-containing protein [Armatimonadota bacterium]|nr:HEAT repeat domain-containing protein [Armatimonadota bacterium]
MQRLICRIMFLSLLLLLTVVLTNCQAATRANVPLMTSMDDKSVQELTTALSSAAPYKRLLAAVELGNRKDKSAIVPLTTLLSDSSQQVRLAAGQALLNLGDRSGIETIKRLLSGGDVETATHAAGVLAMNGDYSGIEIAKSHLNDKSLMVRDYALDAVAASNDDDLAYSALQAGLKDSDQFIRFKAILRLGKRSNRRSIELLAPLMSSSDATVRRPAVRSIAETRLWDALPLLIKALLDSDSVVRYTAAMWLNQLTGQDKPTAPFIGNGGMDKAAAVAQEWRAWWSANKQNYPPDRKLKAPEPPPAWIIPAIQ